MYTTSLSKIAFQFFLPMACAAILAFSGCQDMSNSARANVSEALHADATVGVPNTQYIHRESSDSLARTYIDSLQKFMVEKKLLEKSDDTLQNQMWFFIHRDDIDSLLSMDPNDPTKRADGIVVQMGFVKNDPSDSWENAYKGQLRPYLRPVNIKDDKFKQLSVPYYYIDAGCPCNCAMLE